MSTQEKRKVAREVYGPVEIRKTFEKRKEIIMQGIRACIKDNDKTTLERLKVRLSELELWEDYIRRF